MYDVRYNIWYAYNQKCSNILNIFRTSSITIKDKPIGKSEKRCEQSLHSGIQITNKEMASCTF